MNFMCNGDKSPAFLVILKAKGVAYMEYKQPDRRIKLCWTVYTLVIALIPLSASVVLFCLPTVSLWIAQWFTVLWSSVLTWLLTVYYPLRYRRMRYALGNEAVEAVQGVFFLSHQRLPLSAVRHITAIRGPLERLTGITSLFIRATGGHLLLEGVPADEATAFTRAIL